MDQFMNPTQMSQLYRQLGIDPVAAQQSGVSGLLLAVPQVPQLPTAAQMSNATTIQIGMMASHAHLERNS